MLSQSVKLPKRPHAGPAALLAAAICTVSVQAAGLNDTGQTVCYDAANAPVACSAAVGGDVGALPRQDARYGRDQASNVAFRKVGSGAAGFDYSKISNIGAQLPENAALGSGGNDWACTKDNVSGLVWEIKTTSGVRGNAHTYTWYSTDSAVNGGGSGTAGTDTCGGSLSAAPYNNQCNTQNFVTAVNSTGGLCGATDWRLPTLRELLTLVHSGTMNPAIDTAHFPNNTNYSLTTWSGSATAFNSNAAYYAWYVSFGDGYADYLSRSYAFKVRVVRGGQ